jgi:hypothetical protein
VSNLYIGATHQSDAPSIHILFERGEEMSILLVYVEQAILLAPITETSERSLMTFFVIVLKGKL